MGNFTPMLLMLAMDKLKYDVNRSSSFVLFEVLLQRPLYSAG
jgi:hypothetical protein